MNKKAIGFLATLSMLAVTVFSFGGASQASEFNFAVTPKIPKNQVDKEKSYFDLLLKKGEKQTLEVELRNDTDKEVEVSTTINSATTNINGVVEYGANGLKPDKSLTYNLKDYAKAPEKVKLPKKSKEVLKIELSSPDKDMPGSMVGGITFKEVSKEKEKKNKDAGGLSIKNEFSYMVAIVSRQNEDKVKPNLNLTKAFPGQVNARNVINANLQNDKPAFINQLKLNTKITKRGKDAALYETTKEGMQVAPNSNFDFPTPLEGQELKAGKYTMHILALGGKHEDGKFKDDKGETYRYQWEMTKDFDISADEADQLNNSDVSIKKTNPLWYVLGGAILLALLGLLIFFLKRRNEEDEDEEDDEEEETEAK